MQKQKGMVTVAVAGLLGLLIAGSAVTAQAEDKDIKVTLTKAQLDAAIKTALAAKPGKVVETDAEIEKGKTLCEVKIEAADGKTYEVEVDVAANKVIEVELCDDSDANTDDKD